MPQLHTFTLILYAVTGGELLLLAGELNNETLC
jgi:hypothetical protein